MIQISQVLFCFDCLRSKHVQLFSAKQRTSTRPQCMQCISGFNKTRRIRAVGRKGKQTTWRQTMGVHFLRSGQ
jgi:hypothetical protein